MIKIDVNTIMSLKAKGDHATAVYLLDQYRKERLKAKTQERKEYKQKQTKKRYYTLKAKKRCVKCNKAESEGDSVFCPSCLAYHRVHNSRWYKKNIIKYKKSIKV